MMISRKQLSVIGFSLLLGMAPAVDALGQADSSGYGQAQLNAIRNRNSGAQFSVQAIQNSIRNQSVPVVGTWGVNQRNYLGSGSSSTLSSRSKPFSGVSQGPTVSPYLALSAPRASASDYYNIIRPQQQRQQQDQREQVQAIRRTRQLNQMAARAPYSTTGDANQAPTGHVAVFQSLGSYQNTGGYFPPPSPPKRR